MDHAFVGIVRQRRMVMELRVRPQDMVCDKEVGVAHCFYSLHKLAYGSRISTEFCLGKNRSDVHDVPPHYWSRHRGMCCLLYTIISSRARLANYLPDERGNGDSSRV